MSFGNYKVPVPKNEPIKGYLPGSPEKESLKKELERQMKNPIEIPVIIGGKEIKTGKTVEITAPHDHNLKLGSYHKAGPEHIEMAINEALKAREKWAAMPMQERAAVMLRAADLLAGSYEDWKT